MCGIVGIVGDGNVVHDTVTALMALEYRGYDSYGIATIGNSGFDRTRATGSISSAVSAGLFEKLPHSSIALGHTRWATHGGVTADNAHPHISYDGRFAIVHNGVIENYANHRKELEAAGIRFTSETDSEVIAHLLAREYDRRGDVIEAIAGIIPRLTGEYAIGVISLAHPGRIFGAKFKSPLLAGFDGKRAILSSDKSAVELEAGNVSHLVDGDIVCLDPKSVDVFTNIDGALRPAKRQWIASTSMRAAAQDKGHFPHFMIKEINDVPGAVDAALGIAESDLKGIVPNAPGSLTMVGAGSAYYVAHAAKYIFSLLGGLRVEVLPSDEAELLVHFQRGDTLIAISQSGETFDTLEIARLAISKGATLVSITNSSDSSLERLADRRIRQNAGAEICVLSTKSVISQLVILARIALLHGRATGQVTAAEFERHTGAMARVAKTLEQLIAGDAVIRSIASQYSKMNHWFFIGRGPLYSVALESALKFKEVSYHHAEGTSAGFFKHGTISLIDEDFYTVALLPSKEHTARLFNATLSNVSEIAARQGPIIGFGPSSADTSDREKFVAYVELPLDGDPVADMLVHLVAGQLLAYHCAVELGRNVDQPRSLAKSVTVR